ncbi:hypothetical protein CEXT_317011, partial [Caerostris extrusa]
NSFIPGKKHLLNIPGSSCSIQRFTVLSGTACLVLFYKLAARNLEAECPGLISHAKGYSSQKFTLRDIVGTPIVQYSTLDNRCMMEKNC